MWHGLKKAGHGAKRRGQGAGKLRQQDVTARQVRQGVDVLGAQGLAVENAALQNQQGRDLGEITQGLGDCGHVTLDEGNRRGALEELRQGLDARTRDRAAHQRILEDLVVGAQGAQLSADVRDLGDGEAAVLGDDGGRRGADLGLDFVDGGDLRGLNLAHVNSFTGCRPVRA